MALSAGPTSGGVTQGTQDLAPGVTETQREIVTLIEEGEVISEMTPQVSPSRGFLAPGKDNLTNSVVGFLSRPYEFKNIQWPGTTMRGGLLQTVYFPRDYLKIKAVQEKLAGFRYLRCDFILRVQVNAQPMNAGRLFMVWQPFWDQMAHTPASAMCVSGLTGYPGRVDLDLAEGTSFEIKVPFVSTTSHFDLLTGMGTSGAIQLYVYSPLTGLSEVDATIWIWAENIDVQLPTGLPMGQIQSDWATPTGEDPTSFHQEFSQMRPEPSQARLDKERKPGILSKILDIGGRMAMAASAIPKIGVFAMAGGAIARGLGKLVSIFGWSKPMVDFVPTQVRAMYMRGMTNYNGPFDGKNMAFDWDNQTDIPTFLHGTDEDEMAFAYILKRPVFLDAYQMTASNIAGDLLWKWPVDPTACRKVTNTTSDAPAFHGTGVQFFNTYMSYISNLFQYWRGSICYKWKVVKTPFHSGRIRVAYCPGAQLDTDPTTIDFSKCYQKVFDLRQTTEFDICVPYNWYTPWKDVLLGNYTSTSHPVLDGEAQGMLYVHVVNALRNPSTCASNIEFIVESAAGEDFQFAIPGVSSATFPLIDSQDTMSELSGVAYTSPSGEIQADDMFGNPTQPDVGINALGIGEVITSFRQLLKRYMNNDPSSFDIDFTGWYPYRGIPTEDVGSTAEVLTRLKQLSTMFRWAMSLYRFQSGPMRVSAVDNSIPTDGKLVNTLQLVPMRIGGFDNSVTPAAQVGRSFATQARSQEPVIELEVPFYQQIPALLTDVGGPKFISSEFLPTATQAFRYSPNNEGSIVSTPPGGTTWDKYVTWSHIGERFSFGLMLGPPPTITFPLTG